MPTGVTCPQCGASTPLPGDLRVPTFTCAFCHTELRTRDFSGEGLRSADALLGHLEAAMAGATPSTPAPSFASAPAGTRASRCTRCSAAVDVPMDLRVHRLVCPACGLDQPVATHISDADRLAADMGQQQAANEAYARARAEGVACGRCGGKNEVPDDGSMQVVCRFCQAAILVGEHVDEDAVARRRLYKGVMALKDTAIAEQKARDRRILLAVGAGVALVILAGVCASALGVLLG